MKLLLDMDGVEDQRTLVLLNRLGRVVQQASLNCADYWQPGASDVATLETVAGSVLYMASHRSQSTNGENGTARDEMTMQISLPGSVKWLSQASASSGLGLGRSICVECTLCAGKATLPLAKLREPARAGSAAKGHDATMTLP